MRSQGARAHAKTRRQWRRHVAQRISAARATAYVRSCGRGVRAQPVAPRFTQLIDALDGKSWQILHLFTPDLNPQRTVAMHYIAQNMHLTENIFVAGILRRTAIGVKKKALLDIVGPLQNVEIRVTAGTGLRERPELREHSEP